MLDDLRALLGRDPFVPFRIILTSGNTYEVRDPVQVVIYEAKLEYFFARTDRMAILRLNQLVAFETLDD